MMGLKWSKLAFDDAGVAQKFDEEVVGPIRRFAGRTIDVSALVRGALLPGSIVDRVIDAYRKYLFGEATLQDLPDDPPRFVINAANVQSGALWRFMKPYMRDWRVGEIKKPRTKLAVAVASSAAAPPFVSPVRLELKESDYAQDPETDLQEDLFRTDVVLTDGGVYDNLGLETAWKRYDTVLVSDAGGKMQAEAEPKLDWPRHSYRVMLIIDNQVRALRKRQVIGSYKLRNYMLGQGESPDSDLFKLTTREGAYWGIRTNVADYGLADPLVCPFDKTMKLAEIPTRLKRLPARTQERLINWGYAVCDAAMRRHVDSDLRPPGSFPYPDAGVG
jgi:NTE family protein